MYPDSEGQAQAVRSAMLMARTLGSDIFILEDLTITSMPENIGRKRVLEVIRCPDTSKEVEQLY